MENVLFIDYKTLIDDASGCFLGDCWLALERVAKVGNLHIVCLDNAKEMPSFDYNAKSMQLSKMLRLDEDNFDKTDFDANAVKRWMAGEQVRSFAIALHDDNAALKKAYPNNVVICNGKFSDHEADNVLWIMSNFNLENLSDDIFIIGDCHFFHKNIIKYCNRPWHTLDSNGNIIISDDDIEKMNYDMIQKWNSTISNKSIVYINGDFCFGSKNKVLSIVSKLNGRKRIILGNHDKLKISQYYDIGFERVYDYPILIKQFILISHAPLEWINDSMPYANIYAHVHNSPIYKDFTSNTFCSSVERINYTPKSLTSIIKIWKSFEINNY